MAKRSKKVAEKSELQNQIEARLIRQALDTSDADGMTIKLLATLMCEKEGRVARALAKLVESGDVIREMVYATSYSRNYRAFETGIHRVAEYRISRRALIELVRDQRETIHYFEQAAEHEAELAAGCSCDDPMNDATGFNACKLHGDFTQGGVR